MQRVAPNVRRFDPVFFWVLMWIIAFVMLPSHFLKYGFFDSTPKEIWNSYGWSGLISAIADGRWAKVDWSAIWQALWSGSQDDWGLFRKETGIGIAWFWFVLPLGFLIRPLWTPDRSQHFRHGFDAQYALLCAFLVPFSAAITGSSIGISVIVLYVSLLMIASLALARLDWMGGDRFMIACVILIVSLVGMFIVFPTIEFFPPIFQFKDANGQPDPLGFIDFLMRPKIREIIGNSLILAIAVGIGATFFGLVCAIYTTRIAVRTAFIGRIFAILPIVTPPFVVGLGAVLIVGRAGYLTDWMVNVFGLTKINWVYGFKGIWICQVLAFAPMSYLILDGAIKSLHPSLEEASYTLRAGRWQTFFHVFLPLLRPALANSFLLVAIQSLADFSNPLILGGNYDVMSIQIYYYIAGAQLDYPAATSLGAVLLFFSLGLFYVQYAWIGQRSYVTVSGKSYRGDVQPLPRMLIVSIVLLLILWVIVNLGLYGSIIYGSFTKNWGVDHTLTFANYARLFWQGMDTGAWPSLLTTLLFAMISAPITALLGLLIAYIVVRQRFHGRKTLEFCTMLSFAVPGIIAGIAYLIAFNSVPFILTGTSAIVIISMIFRNIPVGIRAGITGLGQIDKSLDEASLSLRAGSFKTVVYVLLPLLRPAFLSAFVYSFVHAMTTFSAIVFLVTPNTTTATTFMLNRVEDGEYGPATAYGAMLIYVMMTTILIFDALVGEARVSRSKARQTA